MDSSLQKSRVLLTGAGSGIGRSLAFQLARKGATVALVGRNERRLVDLAMAIRAEGGSAFPFAFDLSRPSGHGRLVMDVLQHLGGIDMIINNAGISGFCDFSNQKPEEISRILDTNIAGPLLLTRAVLPHFIMRGRGRIVNVGSAFGSFGFGHFSVYSATKFALRGFSEALRRELDHTGIRVIHVAPRATRTSLNSDAVLQFNERTGVTMDEAEDAAMKILQAVEKGRSDCRIGWQEKCLAGLNALFPRLVDAALRKSNRIARGYASAPSRQWKAGNVRYYADFQKK